MKLVDPSGDVALDRRHGEASLQAFRFADLPAEFTAPYLALRFRFYYNPKKGEIAGNDQNQTSAH